MRPIGFSTGALAKGDFRRGLELQRGDLELDAVELSAMREEELPPLIAALDSLDLRGFTHVSLHAPKALRTLDEVTAFTLLCRVPESWPIIAHPDLLKTPSLWRQLGARLCIENMDPRKSTGRTAEEMHELFRVYPDASFCLDLGHARRVSPTLIDAMCMLRELGPRLRQLHISQVDAFWKHVPLGYTVRLTFPTIADLIPPDLPVIIEAVLEPHQMKREVERVLSVLDVNAAVA
jgi:hypothetical protein